MSQLFGNPRNVSLITKGPRGLLQPSMTKFTQTVPNLVGLTQAAAVTSLSAAGLILGQVTLTAGNIVSQNPAAGSKANKFAPVNVVLTS